jgi:hypothetical protein
MCHRWEIATIVLGGITILLTGVMIRLRGDGEPERSRARVRELEKVGFLVSSSPSGLPCVSLR